MDNVNKKINQLIVDKKKQDIDLKGYKEKLDNLIGVFNNRINNIDEKFKEYCNICFTNYDNKSNDRYNAIEEKMNSLRMENIKHSSELIEKTNELKLDWDKIQSIKAEIYEKFNYEISKFESHNNNLIKVFDSQKQEFSLIKSRFTELSDFIKDVRFRNNLTNMNNNNNNKNDKDLKNNKSYSNLTAFQKKVKFTSMSRRIDFKLKQKLDESFKSQKELNNIDNNKIKITTQYSPAKTEFNNSLYSNKEEEKDKDNKDNKDNEKTNKNYLINKPIELKNISSPLKNYFNSNKEYKGHFKGNKNLSIHSSINKAENNNEIKKNKSEINKESEEEILGEDERIKSIINKKNIKSAKIKEIEKIESTISDIDKEKLSTKILPKLNESVKTKNNKNNKFNKNIRTSPKKNKKYEPYKIRIFLNDDKKNINTIENTKQNNLLSLNYKKENNDNINNKIYKTESQNSSPKREEDNNLDKSDFSNNYKDKIDINRDKKNQNEKNNLIFLTNPSIKEISKNNNINMNTLDSNNHININSEEDNNMNLDFDLLNKKITTINNRMNELFLNSDQKMDKLHQYVKKVFDHLSGIFYFKDLYNQKFSFDFSPKTLMIGSDFGSTYRLKPKTKIIIKKRDKLFSPQNGKKTETFKSLVDKIEPYLIKKFKE